MDSESDPILCQRSEAEDPLRPRPPWKRRPSPRWRPGGTEPAQPGHDFDPPGPRSRTSHSTGRSTGRSRSRMRQLTTAQRPMLGAIHSIQAIHVSPCVSSFSWRFKLGAVQIHSSQQAALLSSLVPRRTSLVSLSRSLCLALALCFPPALFLSLALSLPLSLRELPLPRRTGPGRYPHTAARRASCCCDSADRCAAAGNWTSLSRTDVGVAREKPLAHEQS